MFRKAFLVLLTLVITIGFTRPIRPVHPIKLSKVGDNCWVHTSYQDIGGQPFPSNGMVIETSQGIVLIDTPWGNEPTQQLLDWVQKERHKKVVLAIVTHAHDDRIGGIQTLTAQHIRVISTPLTYERTALIADKIGPDKPEPVMVRDTTLRFGKEEVTMYYPGKAHAPDNVVVWLPAKRLLFGGCMVKSANAPNLGNVADADIAAWKNSLRKVIEHYPQVTTVVPGHGDWGDKSLLDHTMELLEKK